MPSHGTVRRTSGVQSQGFRMVGLGWTRLGPARGAGLWVGMVQRRKRGESVADSLPGNSFRRLRPLAWRRVEIPQRTTLFEPGSQVDQMNAARAMAVPKGEPPLSFRNYLDFTTPSQGSELDLAFAKNKTGLMQTRRSLKPFKQANPDWYKDDGDELYQTDIPGRRDAEAAGCAGRESNQRVRGALRRLDIPDDDAEAAGLGQGSSGSKSRGYADSVTHGLKTLKWDRIHPRKSKAN